MSSENEDIFGVMGGDMDAPVPPPMELKFNPAPNFQQIIEFKSNPEAFNSYEAIERRYKDGRVDIERKKASGAYGVGDSFDREAFENDFRKLNEALEQGMPARLFPAFMPLTPQEADMTAEVYFYGDVPTMEQQAAQGITTKKMSADAIEDALRSLVPSRPISQGIESLLSRVGGDEKTREFVLRQDLGKIPSTALEALKKGKPEIRFFSEKGERGMPGQMGLRFTKRFQPKPER